MVVLYGFSFIIFYSEQCSIPDVKSEDPAWFQGKLKAMQDVGWYPYFWEWNFGNNRVSNIENIVAVVSLLWAFMRTVDLFKLMHLTGERDKWARFWALVE